MSTFLSRFTDKGLNALKVLNADVVADKINLLRARKLTIDVDCTVLCTGKRVGSARRGYNPHHRKVPSYFPITAYLADSAGRGVHEKAIGELKTGLSFDTIPTHDYHTNSAWQQFVILAHNLLVNFQIETGLTKRNRTLKNTKPKAAQISTCTHTGHPYKATESD